MNLDKIKNVIMSPLFVSAATGVVGVLLLMESHPMYSGIAFGIAGCKFLDAFKTV